MRQSLKNVHRRTGAGRIREDFAENAPEEEAPPRTTGQTGTIAQASSVFIAGGIARPRQGRRRNDTREGFAMAMKLDQIVQQIFDALEKDYAGMPE